MRLKLRETKEKAVTARFKGTADADGNVTVTQLLGFDIVKVKHKNRNVIKDFFNKIMRFLWNQEEPKVAVCGCSGKLIEVNVYDAGASGHMRMCSACIRSECNKGKMVEIR